jgi:PKD repeat protein
VVAVSFGIVNWTWTIGDKDGDLLLFEPEVSYVFSDPGIYTVTLNVSDAAGNWNLRLFNVTVKDVTNPIIGVFDVEVDEDSIFSFDGSKCSDNVGIDNWTWSFKDGNNDILIYGSSPSYTFADPGVFGVTLTARDEAGRSASGQFLVTVRDVTKPEIEAGSDRTIVEGSTVTLEGTGSDNVGIVNWTWTFDDGDGNNVLYGQKVNHLFSKPGIFTISLDAKDVAGNFVSDSFVLTVKESGKDVGNKTKSPSLLPFIIGGAILVILIIAIVIVLFAVRRKKEPSSDNIPEDKADVAETQGDGQSLPEEGSPEGSPVPEGSGVPFEQTIPPAPDLEISTVDSSERDHSSPESSP